MAAHFAAPVVDGAEAGERRGQLGDPGLGEDAGVGPRLDGGVLRREPEGVEPDGAEDALALHGLVANDQVTEGVVAYVALVGRPRGVGVHAQGVELRAGVVVVDLVRAGLDPVALPLGLHRLDVVGARHRTRVREAAAAALSRVKGVDDRPGPRPRTAIRSRRLGAAHIDCYVDPHHWGRSSAGRALDWQSRGSWVQVPSPPPHHGRSDAELFLHARTRTVTGRMWPGTAQPSAVRCHRWTSARSCAALPLGKANTPQGQRGTTIGALPRGWLNTGDGTTDTRGLIETMGLVWIRARSELRSSWRTMTVFALVLGIGGGVALTALAGARRTDTAIEQFVSYSRPDDGAFLYGNPTSGPTVSGASADSLSLLPVERRVVDLPQVAQYFRAPYLYLTSSPAGYTGQSLNAIGAADAALFRTVDRPLVVAGKLPDPKRPDDVAINELAAEGRHLHVGSHILLYAASAAQFHSGALTNGASYKPIAPQGPDVPRPGHGHRPLSPGHRRRPSVGGQAGRLV